VVLDLVGSAVVARCLEDVRCAQLERSNPKLALALLNAHHADRALPDKSGLGVV